ncbi:MAG: hypothetical protein FWD61_14825 [Phycisphaerales bacterium]|nr:hypothetical protein [Phycisphaerales bacterium]
MPTTLKTATPKKSPASLPKKGPVKATPPEVENAANALRTRIVDQFFDFYSEAKKIVPAIQGDGRDVFDQLLDVLKANAPKAVAVAPPSVAKDAGDKPTPFDIRRFHRLAVELQAMVFESAMGEDDKGGGYILLDGKVLRDPMGWNDDKAMQNALITVLDASGQCIHVTRLARSQFRMGSRTTGSIRAHTPST